MILARARVVALLLIGLFLFIAYGPSNSPLTIEEMKEKYPEVYEDS